MSYTESQLLPGERIKYQGHLHWFPFLPAYLAGGIFAVAALAGLFTETWWLAILGVVVAVPIFVWTYINKSTSEFSVTDRRVVIKTGWIERRTLETMLEKVETIGVEQSFIGRLFDFGTIIVMGTGGTGEPFKNIARPLEFRRQVQASVSSADDRSRMPISDGESPAEGDAAPVSLREERECPYCAELILKKAKVCKHCGRDVQAIEA